MKKLAHLSRIIFIFLITLSIFRILFFFVHVFGDISFSYTEVFKAFLTGIRFDLAISMILLVLPLTLSLLPIRNKRYQKTLGASVTALFLVMLLMMLIDLIYYSYSQKRLSFEFLIFFHDPLEAVRFVLVSFWYLLPVIIVFGYFIIRFLNISLQIGPESSAQHFRQYSWPGSLVRCGVLILFSVFAIRGGWQGRPLKPIMAFQNDNLALGHLGMNGFYNVVTALYKPVRYTVQADWKKNIETLKSLVDHGSDDFLSDEYPFYRKSGPAGSPQKKNVIIVIMESWGYGDLMRHEGPGDRENPAPFFNAISQKGLFFTRHYAPGARTIQMLPSVVSSIPTLFGNVFITSPHQHNRQRSLANILKEEGYSTFFIYAAKENSMGFSSYARFIGFDQTISRDDFNASQVEQDGAWGVYDEYAFERLLEETRKARKPFLGMLVTIHPHLPHKVPSHRKKDYPPKMDFYDDMRYTDFCLKQFFDQIKKEEYFKDTLFVISGDHAYGDKSPLSIHHIPLLFYAPGFIPARKDDSPASQLDIMPTILNVLNISTEHASMGKSLILSQGNRPNEKPSNQWSLIDMDYAAGFMRDEHILISSKDQPIGLYRFISDPSLTNNLLKDEKTRQIKNEMMKEWGVYSSAVGHSIMNDKIIPR